MSGMCTQAPAPGVSEKFANSKKLPFPWSWYGRREIRDQWSAPIKGITISESSQLSSVSQLGRSHPVSPLHSQIPLVQSQDCANVLRSLKIGCVISRLARNFRILRMRSAISRLGKFLDCAEHIYLMLRNAPKLEWMDYNR